MTSKGPLPPHTIRKNNRPEITEVKSMIQPTLPNKPVTPTHSVIYEPIEDPDYIAIEIELPMLVSFKSLILSQLLNLQR
jgi:hypothetical protein